MFAKVSSVGLFGLNSFMVDAEVDISRGAPLFAVGGLPDTVVSESRERIRSALRASSIDFPIAKVTVNLAPASTKKSGSVHDLAILIAIVKSMGIIYKDLSDCCFIGEVSLNGDVRGVNGVLPMVLKAYENNIKTIFVPSENIQEASVAEGITIYGINKVEELIDFLCDVKQLTPAEKYIASEIDYKEPFDFAEVKGQTTAKKALEIAAAGGHNALLIGTPGSGKSMLAKRIPSILPPLTFQESLETTNIHSISGLLDPATPLIIKRPFRAPHHTISCAGLVGGGSVPHPGELSLAHNGLLFLDELAEFDRRTLEIMRQPLEERIITISRSAGTVTYPCAIMLVGAMNPCPCGYFGHPKIECKCSPKQVSTYLSKISGPMLDRFDLHIDVAPVEFSDLSSDKKEEPSEEIRQRVIEARKIQIKRFEGTDIHSNAQITADKLQDMCPMDSDAKKRFSEIFDKLNLSGRAFDRILKVSRTIADLDNKEIINKKHITQATQYRSLDRKYWSK